jgi:hypothetical protein
MPLSNQFVAPTKAIRRAASIIPQTATTTFFNVTGIVDIVELTLVVTTVVASQATVVKWRFTPTGGTVGDVSGTLDLNAAPVGAQAVAHAPTTAGAVSQNPTLASTTGGGGATLGYLGAIRLKDGALGLNCAANSSGGVRAILKYVPLEGGSVAAA